MSINEFVDIVQAALLLRMTPSGVRSAMARGELTADGRGGRNVAMFRLSTLEAYVERRMHKYDLRFGTADTPPPPAPAPAKPSTSTRRHQRPKRPETDADKKIRAIVAAAKKRPYNGP